MPHDPLRAKADAGPWPSSRPMLVAAMTALVTACLPDAPEAALWSYTSFERRPWHGYCSATDPLLRGDTLYVGLGYAWDGDARMHALEASTGRVLWRTDGGGSCYGERLLLHEGLLVFGQDGELHAVDAATGEARWSVAGTRPDRIAEGGLVVAGRGRSLVALDIRTGAPRWRIDVPFAPGRLVALGDSVYVTPSQGMDSLAVVHQDGGALVTRLRPGLSPRIESSGDRLVEKVRTPTGAWETWLVDPSGSATLRLPFALRAVLGDTVVADLPGGGFVMFDGRTGEEVGRFPPHGRGERLSWDVVVDGALLGRVLVGVPKVLESWDLDTGRPLARFETGDWAYPPAVGSDALFVVSEDCRLHALPRTMWTGAPVLEPPGSG